VFIDITRPYHNDLLLNRPKDRSNSLRNRPAPLRIFDYVFDTDESRVFTVINFGGHLVFPYIYDVGLWKKEGPPSVEI